MPATSVYITLHYHCLYKIKGEDISCKVWYKDLLYLRQDYNNLLLNLRGLEEKICQIDDIIRLQERKCQTLAT